MSEERKKDVLERILRGDRITEEVKTKRGKFVIALPLPKDIRAIEVEVARKMEGLPESQFQKDTIANFRAYATLDAVIIESPEWWQNLESAEDCPDDALIMEIYRGYLQFYRETQRRIDKSRFHGNSEIGRVRTKDKAVGDTSLQSVADRSEV